MQQLGACFEQRENSRGMLNRFGLELGVLEVCHCIRGTEGPG